MLSVHRPQSFLDGFGASSEDARDDQEPTALENTRVGRSAAGGHGAGEGSADRPKARSSLRQARRSDEAPGANGASENIRDENDEVKGRRDGDAYRSGRHPGWSPDEYRSPNTLPAELLRGALRRKARLGKGEKHVLSMHIGLSSRNAQLPRAPASIAPMDLLPGGVLFDDKNRPTLRPRSASLHRPEAISGGTPSHRPVSASKQRFKAMHVGLTSSTF